MLTRIIFVGIMLGLWFLTQKLLGGRGLPNDGIQDKIHIWTAALNKKLQDSPAAAKWLLVFSSLGIDLTGLYLLADGIFGGSITPFLGLVVLFSLRQLSQYLTALPPPQGMIWRHPGVPSLLVTYGVSNDLFFSGHTALAVYGGLQLFHTGVPALEVAGVMLAIFEMVTVLILRAHWTMDVYAGIVTAILVDIIALRWGPAVDRFLATFAV